MTTYNPEQVLQLRRIFKAFNKWMVMMWRLGLGSIINAWPGVIGRVMVLSHIGRKTGIRRYTPLNYTVVDDKIYCTSGFGEVSDWYLNTKHYPDIEIWLPGESWAGVIEEVDDSENWLYLMREVLIASGFAAYLTGLQPKSMSDEVLRQKTQGYRLLQIQKNNPTSGPRDLSWMWLLLALTALIRKLRSKQRTIPKIQRT
jgi:deazaflavin-dependent oxidoreductase (nitroreductase family)